MAHHRAREQPPRIQDPSDFVHQEIALGLRRGLPVFPVLVGRATMPLEADLPDGLKKLAVCSAVEISDSRWEYDVGVLIKNLEMVPRVKPAVSSSGGGPPV